MKRSLSSLPPKGSENSRSLFKNNQVITLDHQNSKNGKETVVPPYVAVVGPTASGKSALAMQLATQLGGEIVNCDSVQVYRNFDIGSAKPSFSEREQIKHHLIDIVDFHEPFDASTFAERARKSIADIHQRGKIAIVVGGTGLYLRCLWGQSIHPLPTDAAVRASLQTWSAAQLREALMAKDPERAEQIHANDHFRLARAMEIITITGKPVTELAKQEPVATFAPKVLLRLDIPRAELHKRIAQRCQQMLAAGFVEEVRRLLDAGCPITAKPMQSIGYRQVAAYLTNPDINQSELTNSILAATRQYAKRQTTWFKSVPGSQTVGMHDDVTSYVTKVLS